MSLKIKEFKLEDMVKNASIIIIGKQKSGKSWLCKNIIDQLNLLSGTVVCPTEETDPFYENPFPNFDIHYDFEFSIIENMLNKQKNKIKADIILEDNTLTNKIDKQTILVLDDCMYKKSCWTKNDTISELFMNGCCYQITYILTMQYSLGISPELRSNFDYIFLLAEDYISNQKRIYEHYAGMFPTFDSFQLVFNKLTDKYGCMVIDNRVKSKNLTDKIFWYKSKNEKNDFRIGCRQFKQFHDQHFDPNWKKKKKPLDINDLIKKRKNKANFMVEQI